MARVLGPYELVPHGRRHNAVEPLVFHCNFYNYWLQKTILLDESLGMEKVIQDAGTSAAYPLFKRAASLLSLETPEERKKLCQDTFSELGFGLMDLSKVTAQGGIVTCPISHYGRCLRQASGANFARPQSYFDAGYAAAAVAFVFDLPVEHFEARIEACQSMGAPEGKISLHPRDDGTIFPLFENKAHLTEEPPPPYADCNINEAEILEALSGLDFSGNEEGLAPRFGVMLTNHFASFYNRISFEFVRIMADTGLVEAAETLLLDAGYRCAFHTFGGIMSSAEWDAVVKPQCQDTEDWVHGMVAVVNALGWGVWRVAEISANRAVLRLYDDYESCGWLDMYGQAERDVNYLAAAGVAGMMNLIHVGRIHEKPDLNLAFYEKCFEAEGLFAPKQTKCMARGDAFTEIVVER